MNFFEAPINLESTGVIMIATTLGILLLVFLLTPVISYVYNLKQKLLIQQAENTRLKSVIETSEEARCWWSPDSSIVTFTQAFAHLLGLNSDQPIEFIDITNQFTLVDADKLDASIKYLKESHHPFHSTLTMLDNHTLIHVHGVHYVEEGESLFVLSLYDVTNEQKENRHQLQLLNSITKECNRLQVMVDSAPIALWYRNSQNKIEYCNLVYAGALDSTPEMVVHESRELGDRYRSTSPYQLAIKARETGCSQTQRTHLVIDGARRLIEVTEVPLADSNATIGYAMDWTEIEESSAELAKHIAAHQEVMHYLSTPMAIFGPDTHLTFYNTAYLKLFQFEENWLDTKPSFADVLQNLRERRKLPEYSDFQAFKRDQLQLFNTLIQPLQELVHQPDGHILRSMAAPHPLGGLFFLYEDVTDKLALERRYNTLIAVQKETIDHLYEGIVVFGSDNRLRLSNPAVGRIWQLDPMDLMPGRHATELLDQIQHMFTGYSDWNFFRNQLLSFINQRIARTGRFSRQDQSMLQYSYVPLPDGSHLLSFVDVSDRWRFEQALQERNHALERADRLKSDFISHVSYELRAPLNTIIGFTEILTNQYFGTLNERQLDYCRGIADSSQRLLSLINDILDLASVEAGQLSLKPQQVELESFLSSLVGLVYNRSHDQGLEIIRTNETLIKTFIADERRLKQALFNLLTNAIKFTPSGGTIELKAYLSDDNENLCFSVSDTGVGINEEDQGRLFKLFETGYGHKTKIKHNGVGLGLPLVKSFVELHGGTINIASQVDKGTTITASIPLVRQNAAAETPVAAPIVKSEISLNEDTL